MYEQIFHQVRFVACYHVVPSCGRSKRVFWPKQICKEMCLNYICMRCYDDWSLNSTCSISCDEGFETGT